MLRTPRSLTSLVLLAASCATGTRVLSAQSVLVAPNVIVIDGRTRTTAITLVNTGGAPAEVTLGTTFGYPVSDSAGVMRLQTFDSLTQGTRSAAGFVRAYPSSFVLPAGGRRLVRLMATPPDTIRDGEYWSRLVVTTRAARSRGDGIASTAAQGAMQIGLDLELRSLLPLFYRQGVLSTGVSADSLSAEPGGDSLHVRFFMRRTGNAAFVGSVRARLRDGAGNVVATSLLPLGVYQNLAPRLSLSRRGLRPGVYDLQVEAVSERPDVLPQYLVQSPTTSRRMPIRLDGSVP